MTTPDLSPSESTLSSNPPSPPNPCLEPDAKTDDIDGPHMLVNYHVSYSRIGFVGTGICSGGLRIVAKLSDGTKYMEHLLIEARNYRDVVAAGLGEFVPTCFGVFKNDEERFAVLVAQHVGRAFKEWSDLSDEQW